MSTHVLLPRGALISMLLATLPVAAQSHHDHASMDHSTMDHSSVDPAGTPQHPVEHTRHGAAASSQAQQSTEQQPLHPIPVPTDADRAAAFPALDHRSMQHAPSIHSLLRVDRLEQQWNGRHGSGQAWEANAWIGGDINRLWLRSEGERSGGRTESADLEALYGRSISPWWDVLAGVRQDFRPGDTRTWAALGIQGLAPYKFETSATLYAGSGGQLMAKAEVEYEILLTNRLILQPRVEAMLAARDETRRGIGRGLNTLEAGLRLRYEVTRRFAPYIGVNHERRFGEAADHAGNARDTHWVTGVRMWF